MMALTYTDYSVLPSRNYRYKLRARNVNGFSDFSPIAIAFAASSPEQSPAPLRVAYSSTEIMVQVFAPLNNGGDNVISFELQID